MNPLTFLFLQMSLASDIRCFLGDMSKCLLTVDSTTTDQGNTSMQV